MLRLYRFCDRLWQKTEIIMSVFIIITMTLITFLYTLMNNLYVFFYWLGDHMPIATEIWFKIGDLILDLTNNMTWSLALTKAAFAWLIFFMMSYGVRVGGHIGVDLLIKAFSNKVQIILAYIGLGACLSYAFILLYASVGWVKSFYTLQIAAEDLHQLGILQWQIAVIVPLGFLLVIFRYLEIGYRIATHQQIGLGLADEAKDALALKEEI